MSQDKFNELRQSLDEYIAYKITFQDMIDRLRQFEGLRQNRNISEEIKA